MLKTCTKCKLEQPIEAFSKNARSKDGFQYKCKACVKSYREANSESISAYQKEYNLINKEKKALYAKKYTLINKESVVARHKKYRVVKKTEIAEQRKGYKKRYILGNRHKVYAAAAKRRAFKLQATPAWADQSEIASAYEQAAFATEFFGISFHVDHIVPFRSKFVCGLHCQANLQVIHATDNLVKNNRYWPNMPGEEQCL